MKRERLRGNIESILLATIKERGPAYGLEIARAVENQSEGEVKLTVGALYPALHRLVRKGLITEEMRRPPHGGGPVSYYDLTKEGREALREEQKEMSRFFQAMKGLGLLRYG